MQRVQKVNILNTGVVGLGSTVDAGILDDSQYPERQELQDFGNPLNLKF